MAGPGQVNAVAATTDAFRITGVVVLPGIEAPSAARSPLIMRPFDQELVACQRYYEKTYDMVNPVGSGFMQSGVVQQRAMVGNDSIAQDMWVPFKQRKRVAPTLTIWSPGTANTTGKVRNQENGGGSPNSVLSAGIRGVVYYNPERVRGCRKPTLGFPLLRRREALTCPTFNTRHRRHRMALPVLDFPASPAVGDRYPTPVVTGQPQYRWDGLVWLATDAAADATDVSVAEDQPFTEVQKAQGRKNIYAAPFDAMAYSGMQINGSMEVSQEKGTAQTTTHLEYIVDGWRLFLGGTAGMACGQAVGGPPGITNIIFASTLTAQPSLGASDQVFLFQNIEGWRVARLAWGTTNASPITIAFWSNHVRTGVYSVSVHNGVPDRSYSASYTQNASNVFQYNTITIPGDTVGTWARDNTTGMQIVFGLGSGTANTAPSANTWSTGSYSAAPGQINGVAATSDSFRITGVVVLPGIEAPSAARSPLIMRPYDQELITCKRYYQKFPGIVVDINTVCQSFPYPVEFRAQPALSGGGAGFNTASASTTSVIWYQTTRSYQNMTADARL